MSNSYTPGPWERQGNSLVSNAPGLNYGSRYVIEVHEGTIYSEHSADGASLDCTAENARLIAAAPALYEALSFLMNLKDLRDKYGKDEGYEEAKGYGWASARSALLLANTGGTENG